MTISNISVPEYRVRLFLSVDLTGSTAFKHKQNNPLKWVKVFQKFYGSFPKILSKQYESIGQKCNLPNEEKQNGFPKLWKTVGDEILFCCKVQSIHHVSVCIEAFICSLEEFGREIETDSLNTKGNAWVASFPTPNSSIRPVAKYDSHADSLSGKYELVSEEIEKQADEDPSQFDFLGKGIDSGFRISKNSSINTLTISPGLAILLLEACRNQGTTFFEREIRLAEMQSFKGVANNDPYPVVVIDVFRTSTHKELFNIQNDLLRVNQGQEPKQLQEFLRKFLQFYGIEIPEVRLYATAHSNVPEFYNKYAAEWEKEKQEIEQKRINEEQSSKDLNDEGLEEIISDVEDKGLNLAEELVSN